MPTTFTSVTDGQTSDDSQLNQFIAPLNNLEKGLTWWAGTTGGTSTAYTATATPTPTAGNVAGTPVRVQLHTACGAAPTFALNGMAALPMRRNAAALGSGDLASGSVLELLSDGTYWHVIGGGGGSASVATLDEIGDVAVTGASNGTVLMKVTGGWEHRNLIIADINSLQTALDGKSSTSHTHSLDNLSDAAITTPATGNVLRYDGTNFVNQNLATTDIQSGNFTNARLASGTASSGLSPVSNGSGSSVWGTPTPAAHNHAAGDINSGTMAAARLGSGTADSTTYLRGDGQWATPSAAAPAAVACQCSKNASQTLTANTDNLVTWQQNDHISDAGLHSTGSNTSRFVAINAGVWELIFALPIIVSGSQTLIKFRLFKNGTVVRTVTHTFAVGSGYTMMATPAFLFSAAANDYFELVANPDAAGTTYLGYGADGTAGVTTSVATFKKVGS